ncbi:MAG: radical SAM protein [Promethearchaeota archaeon]|nr:MAG: radical SAM protein [Candidatus Lokiarchaeota archaeon]
MGVEKIRVSIGSASRLGLYECTFKEPPTTCYLMTYYQGRCIANCGFCPQARKSETSLELLSRVTWPIYDFKEVLTKLTYLPPNKRFKRICLQALNYSENFEDIKYIVKEIRKENVTPISVAIPPFSEEKLKELKRIGVDRVGIALDGSSKQVFESVKGEGVNGPYRWEHHFKTLETALDIFRNGKVSTHIIIGLGEKPKDVIKLIKKLNDMTITVGLFAFTPIKGTKFQSTEPPDLLRFRKIQLARYLIVEENRSLNSITFNLKGDIIQFILNKADLLRIIQETDAFLTTGCPGCNRPYYTSKPSGPIYNFPRKLTKSEIRSVYDSLVKFVN